MRLDAGKIAGIGAAAALLSLALTPAISAVMGSRHADDQSKVSLRMLGTIGSFTPVTRDQRLALAYAEAARESQTRSFRFTPASGSMSGERSLTVLVRAPGEGLTTASKRTQANLGIAPMAYSLGKGKGLDRFAVDASEQMQELDPIAVPVEMPTANFVLKAKPKRFSTNIQLESRQQTAVAPTASTPQTLGTEKSYTVDLSSSYSLTRNLDVQAGVRYRGPDNRLVPLTDQQQDSQAVYVGTKFKF